MAEQPRTASPVASPVASPAALPCPGAEPLRALLEHTSDVLSQSNQELGWLTTHPLYLPTPLAPLFKALGWRPSEAAYLLAALLTDQKVLLLSEEP